MNEIVRFRERSICGGVDQGRYAVSLQFVITQLSNQVIDCLIGQIVPGLLCTQGRRRTRARAHTHTHTHTDVNSQTQVRVPQINIKMHA